MIVKQEAWQKAVGKCMKRMCLVMLTALAIIICVIAFQSFREARDGVYDGILIEENADRMEIPCLYLETNHGNGGLQ